MADTGQTLVGGFIARVPPNASQEVQIAALNSIIDKLNANLQIQVFSDSETRRTLMGYSPGGWAGGDFGMKVSLPGVDVTVATDSELLFSWDFTTGTMNWYDPVDQRNYLRTGILPDGTGGWITAALGFNVDDTFTS